ncbi:MAG TPA: hypothetical protein P5513_05690 [Candidatus Diapherotrites archaeon]|nr:hypothetical protein [Candidatus Diapherotrites archaeon]
MEKEYIPNYAQFPSEFLVDGDLYKIFSDNGLRLGRMISGSKSWYSEKYPDHLVIFNANIITESRGKIWYGDLDITFEIEKLKKIAKILNEDLYVLYESDARFENENAGFKYWKDKSIIKIDCYGTNS